MSTQKSQVSSTMSKQKRDDNKEKDEDFKVIFVDTSLNTCLTVVASPLDSVYILEERILMEHFKLFPNFGKIELNTLQVKRDGIYYYICESVKSMKLRMAFRTFEDVFVLADVAKIRRKRLTNKNKKHRAEPSAHDLQKMEDVGLTSFAAMTSSGVLFKERDTTQITLDTRVVQVNQRCYVSGSDYSYAVTNTTVDGLKNIKTNDKDDDGVHESLGEGKRTVEEVKESEGISKKKKTHETKISVPESLNLSCPNNGDQELASDSRQEASELLKPADINISKPKETVTDDQSQVRTEISQPVLSNAPEEMRVDKPEASKQKSKKTKQNKRTSQVIANFMNDNLKQDGSKNPEEDIECSSVISKKTCKRKLIFPSKDAPVTEKCYESERTRSAAHQGNVDEAHPTDVHFDKLGQLVSEYQVKDEGNEENVDEIVPESPISSPN